jgi:hypothetical protein
MDAAGISAITPASQEEHTGPPPPPEGPDRSASSPLSDLSGDAANAAMPGVTAPAPSAVPDPGPAAPTFVFPAPAEPPRALLRRLWSLLLRALFRHLRNPLLAPPFHRVWNPLLQALFRHLRNLGLRPPHLCLRLLHPGRVRQVCILACGAPGSFLNSVCKPD